MNVNDSTYGDQRTHWVAVALGAKRQRQCIWLCVQRGEPSTCTLGGNGGGCKNDNTFAVRPTMPLRGRVGKARNYWPMRADASADSDGRARTNRLAAYANVSGSATRYATANNKLSLTC